MTPQIRVVSDPVAKTRRRPRRPRHTFNLKTKPYEIAPFCIAPVLPGETMKSAIWQSRAVSDPVKNKLIGWHKEYYLYYVPLLALEAWDTTGLLQNMMIDVTTDVSSLQASADGLPYYTFQGGMEFLQYCVEAIVKHHFRDEDEAVSVASIENYYAAQLDQENAWNSMKFESATGDDDELPGVDDLEELDILPTFTTEYAQWEIMRDSGMTDLDYDDYLKSYGVNVPKHEEVDVNTDTKYEPELLRMARSWQYPSNTVQPSDGSVTSALSWSIAERADKDRFFKYPGFLIGITVTRPKIYLGNQLGNASGLLNDAYRWLPAVLQGHPYTSVTEELDSLTVGPFQNHTEDYWYDMKDLFLYGDQLVNHTMSAADNHGLALPAANTLPKYATDALVESLFVTTGSEYIREDGAIFFNILSRFHQDTTPS